MPGGHGARKKPLRLQSDGDLCSGILGPPALVGLLLLATFLGRTSDPSWRAWLATGLTATFFAAAVWFVSRPRWRELQRRRRSGDGDC